VVVEAKAGANSSIGTDLVAKADPDGHTLLLASISIAVVPSVMKTPWDPVRHFTAAAYLGVSPNIVVVHPSLPVHDVKGLVAYAKAKPSELNYGNPGNGSSLHLSAELLQQVNGVKLTAIAYKGSPPSVPDLLSGQLHVGFYPYSVIIGHIRSGKVRALGVYAPARLKQLPEVPTMAEQGQERAELNAWFALLAPKGTPQAVIDRINKEVNAVLAEPQTITALDVLGITGLAPWSAQQTTAMVAAETSRWAEFIPKAGIKGE
jgi:tripartite-type tricarboxylate transporter receptor subunit TctC